MRAVAGNGKEAGGGGAEGPGRPGVSSVEVYGFVGWITSAVAYVLFLLWAYTPDYVLSAHGITYYPSKHWALALPAWACVSVVFAYWVYESLCMVTCPAPGGPTALAGAHSRRREEAGLASYFPGATRSIPPLVDVPQQLISAVLHGGVSPREAEADYERRRRRYVLQ
ncbi:phosphatidylinositol N-acetylglucosaminyltransferase subunit P isoform X1 [Micractinium conductrix]|uniref:Phosphatidylinositol N-acetylglucosaminyltransferase subunit P isoform X1 n=1 Tax=Micractinium conductrix TaxID=554055 RepID=A0A2P6V2M8_9CHLO|nr:phosphatidylinositol N-acetylglucosaminyltransferase subunit P isoform X1 [Micractinium conductrix]|eukprot:PSC68340.1 phosphatidylinositol N-acetylglucosaminyltransferase subunit P isoform X1 [Micractinium conductrix]